MTWHHFSWQAQYFRQMEWKNRKTHWHDANAFSVFERSLAELFRFLMLSTSKIEEVWHNWFVFGVVMFKN